MTYNTQAFYSVMLAITPTRPNGLTSMPGVVSPSLTGNFYDGNGVVHGGVDFQYDESVWLSQQPQPNNLKWGNGPVNSSHPPIYAPVSGRVVSINGNWGWVVIQAADGTYHRLLHMDTVSVNENDTVVCGQTQVGTLGGRGPSGPNEYSNHVHYDIYLESNGQTGWQAPVKQADGSYQDQDLRIDPLVYWTPGLNPYAGELSSTSFDTQKLNSTGLLVTSTAVRDVNNDGVPDSQGYLKENEQAYLSFEINTPHTQAVVLRIRFSGESLKAGQLLFDTANPNVSVDSFDPNTVYLTLPSTQSQSVPNPSALLGLTYDGFEDLDFASAVLHYTVEAGYFRDNFWYAYNAASGGNNVFTPVKPARCLCLTTHR
jgi:murein DD-endopeptidase MepM/ murein hydrolase activator NlpD